ncbi:hypothetical protein [Roseiconus nitratireducens]|nr:hypothetical protein [Roseiconus nitratireducens]
MKSVSRFLLGTMAAGLLSFSLGCEPPKPPAPVEEPTAEVSDNTTANTTAGTETPVAETPAEEEAPAEEAPAEETAE